MVSLISVSSTNLTKADEKSDWQKNAITAPVQGKLVGAGYIDIKFDGTLENASGYQVYFDGKNVYSEIDDLLPIQHEWLARLTDFIYY